MTCRLTEYNSSEESPGVKILVHALFGHFKSFFIVFRCEGQDNIVRAFLEKDKKIYQDESLLLDDHVIDDMCDSTEFTEHIRIDGQIWNVFVCRYQDVVFEYFPLIRIAYFE